MWLVLVHATWTYKQFWYQPPFLVTNSSTINRLKSICHQWRLSCQDSGLLGMILGFPHVFCKLRCKVMKLTRILDTSCWSHFRVNFRHFLCYCWKRKWYQGYSSATDFCAPVLRRKWLQELIPLPPHQWRSTQGGTTRHCYRGTDPSSLEELKETGIYVAEVLCSL